MGHSRRFCHVRWWSAYTPIADEFGARADFRALMSVVRRKAGVLMRLVYVPDGPKTVAAKTQIAQEFLVGYFDLIIFFSIDRLTQMFFSSVEWNVYLVGFFI